jgi:tetratricopeptide (TPR) repeat protein
MRKHTHRQIGLLGHGLWLFGLLLSMGGCGATAKVEVINGEPGRGDATLDIVEVKAGSNEHGVQGVRLLNLKKWEAAAEEFKLALADQPKSHQSRFGLGAAQEMMGNTEDALQSYQQAYQDSGNAKYLHHYNRLKESEHAEPEGV